MVGLVRPSNFTSAHCGARRRSTSSNELSTDTCRQVHLRPLDRRQPRPRPVRRAGPRRPVARRRREACSASSARAASTSTTTTWSRSTRPPPSATRSSRTSSRRSRTTAWSCRWRRPTCSPIRSSRTAPSPPTTRRSAPTPCRRRCGAMDLGAELGAKIYVFWGGREGTETDAADAPTRRSSGSARRSTSSASTRIDKGYGYKFALEAKPNEPRGDIYFATTGNYLGLHPDARPPRDGRRQPRVRARDDGRPELRPRRRAGVRSRQAVPHRPERPEAGPLRPGLPLRRGEPASNAFFLVKLLEDVGYDGPRHFDAHAYRTEDYEDVKDFASGCMRTYLILKEKAARWNADAEIQGILVEAGQRHSRAPAVLEDGARRRSSREPFDREGDRRARPRLRAPRSADDGDFAGSEVGRTGARQWPRPELPARPRLIAHTRPRSQTCTFRERARSVLGASLRAHSEQLAVSAHFQLCQLLLGTSCHDTPPRLWHRVSGETSSCRWCAVRQRRARHALKGRHGGF